MSKCIDITGKHYGLLTVLKRVNNDKFGKAQWLCQCECGSAPKVINGNSLRRGLTTSCGCNKLQKLKTYNDNQVVNETGNIYGYLTVIDRNFDNENQNDGRAMWNCYCKCGNTCVVSGKLLREGKTTSCGCRRQSLGEEKIENILSSNNLNYAKEYTINVRKEKIYQYHPARFDFALFDNNNQLLYFIEYDGEQHFEKNIRENGLGYNSQVSYQKTHERDLLKNQWCLDNNIPLIRIPYTHFSKISLEDLQLNTSQFIVH